MVGLKWKRLVSALSGPAQTARAQSAGMAIRYSWLKKSKQMETLPTRRVWIGVGKPWRCCVSSPIRTRMRGRDRPGLLGLVPNSWRLLVDSSWMETICALERTLARDAYRSGFHQTIG